MQKKTLLITGASGVVGSELTKKFFKDDRFEHVTILLRNKNSSEFKNSQKLKIIYGDITKKNLGLSKADYKNLTKRTESIIHCAADTKFSLPIDIARRVNYHGLVNIVGFVNNCNHIQKCAFISTAYVAGKRSGIIKENELEHSQGFVNTYEQSKYEAEALLNSYKRNFPLNIYRLSTIIGRASDGYVPKFDAIHLALKLYYNSLIPFIPASKNSTIDFISLDYATNSIFHIFNNKFKAGETYHIVAGNEKSLTIEDLINQTYSLFIKFNPGWSKKGIEKPAIVDLETFELMAKTTRQLKNPLLSQITKSMETFVPQLMYPKEFDNSKAENILEKADISAQPLSSYYGKVIKYCLTSNWGKKVYKEN